MTTHAKWVLLRLIAPLAVGGAVTVATWGNRYFDVLTPLAWSLFIVHVLATFAFRRTHLLDTGSFFCLIFGCVEIAELSEARQVGSMRAWSILILIYTMYAFLSFIGRRRADMTAQHKGVSPAQVIAAVAFLLVATIACAASKVAVGFLFVPGLLLVLVILLFALLRRESSRADNSNT